MTRHVFLVCAPLLLACVGSPADAGQRLRVDDFEARRAIQQAIYEDENLIASLEANPATDDGYKAPIIRNARIEITRLRAALVRPQWRWRTPCCYGRPPIHIRWAAHRTASHLLGRGGSHTPRSQPLPYVQ